MHDLLLTVGMITVQIVLHIVDVVDLIVNIFRNITDDLSWKLSDLHNWLLFKRDGV